jgi:ABC-type branched-subunit amino acid transport system substrate-binding protein
MRPLTCIATMARPAAALAAALAAMTMALAACSSNSADSSDGQGGSAGSAAYKLMVFGEFSVGPGAQLPVPYPQIAAGARAAAAAINSSGGVNHHRIDIIACDTKGSPDGATVCASQAVADKVTAVVGALDLTGDYMSVLQQAGIPAIGPYAIAQTLVNPDSFPLYGGSAANLAGSVALLARQGVKSVAVVADESAGLSAYSAILKPVQAHFPGLKISLDPIASTAVDLAPVVAQADRSAGIVLATNSPASAVSFLRDQQESGVKRPISSSTTQVTPTLLAQAGPLLTDLNVYVASAWLPATDTQNRAVAAFDKAMNAEDPDAAKDDFSMNAYSAVQAFAKVAAGKPVVTPSSVIRYLKAVKALDLGLVAPLQFTTPSADTPGLPRLFNPDVIILQVRDGKLVPVTGQFVNAYSQQ